MPAPATRANVLLLEELARKAEHAAQVFGATQSSATSELCSAWASGLDRVLFAYRSIEESVDRYKGKADSRWDEHGKTILDKFAPAAELLVLDGRPRQESQFRKNMMLLFTDQCHSTRAAKRSEMIRQIGLDYLLLWAAAVCPSDWTGGSSVADDIFSAIVLQTSRSDLQLSIAAYRSIRAILTSEDCHSREAIKAIDEAIDKASSKAAALQEPRELSGQSLAPNVQPMSHLTFEIGALPDVSLFISQLGSLVAKRAESVKLILPADTEGEYRLEVVLNPAEVFNTVFDFLRRHRHDA